MEQIVNNFRALLERSAFGVCSALGLRMGISTSRVRLYFIYISFVAMGSPIIIYLFLAFWLNLKKYIKQERSTIWDL